MQHEIMTQMHKSFEEAAKTESGVTYWLAREIQPLLEYARWENFETAIERAKTACQTSEQSVENHFREVTKMVEIGSGAPRPTRDYMLTRYACYLIAQNGDPRKEAIAFALHFIYYNFGRIHKTLRVTPAMAAGVTDHVWSLEEIAGLVKDEAPKKRGSYKKKENSN